MSPQAESPTLLKEYQNLIETLPSLYAKGIILGYVLMFMFWIAIRIAGPSRLPPSLQFHGFWSNSGYVLGGAMYFACISSAFAYFGKADWLNMTIVVIFMPFWHVMIIRPFILWKFVGRLRLDPPRHDEEIEAFKSEEIFEMKTQSLPDSENSLKVNQETHPIKLAANVKKASLKRVKSKNAQDDRRL